MTRPLEIESSCFLEIEYSPEELTLYVTFNDSRRWAVLGVDEAVVEELQNSGSAGRYYNTHIKNYYEHYET